MKVLRIVLRAFPLAVALLLLVVLALAMSGRIERTVEARGEVQVGVYQVVRPQVAGFVRQIEVEPGDRVGVGDVLVRLEDPQFETELAVVRRRVIEVEAQLDQSRLELRLGQGQRQPLERGLQEDAVERSRLDAEITTSLRREAELTLEARRQKLGQVRRLGDVGLVSGQQLRENEQEVLVAEERLAQRVIEERQARREIPGSRRSFDLLVVEQESRNLEVTARIHQLEAELRLWRQEQERLESLRQLHTLRASLAGVVIGEPTNDLLDRYLGPGEELFQVIDPQSILFVSRVPEEAMVRVRSGQPAQVELVGLPRNRFESFAGRVERVGQLPVVEAEATPGYSVDIQIDKPWITLDEGPFFLRGGMRGTAQIAYRSNVSLLRVFYDFLTGKPQVPDRRSPPTVADAGSKPVTRSRHP